MPAATPTKPNRFRLLGWALALSVTSLVGVGLASLLVTVASLVCVWIGVPLTIWTVSGVQAFADWHRTSLGRLTGIEIASPYRPVPEGDWMVRLRAVAHDSANWRDLAWLLANSVIGFFLCILPVVLFGAGVFYILMPALWARWPNALNESYGLFTVHSQSTSFLTIPIGVVALLLCWWWTPGLIRADAVLARGLLAPTARSRLAGPVRQLSGVDGR